MTEVRDLSGQRFNRLLVLKRVSNYVQPNGRQRTRWECQCDCGNICYVTSDRLLSGNTQSCGCIKQEYYDAKNKNRYEKMDGYYIGYTNKGEPFYFDEEYYDKVSQYTWLVNKENYIIATDKSTKKQIWLHRLIFDLPPVSENPILVDHIHGKETRNDNRKSNLRLVTNVENGRNVGLQKNNKTGVTGVSFDIRCNKYQVSITIKNKQIYLGRFTEFEEAVKVRKEAEEKYYGEYSYDASQKL